MLVPLTAAREVLESARFRRPRVVQLPLHHAIGRLAGGLVRAGRALPERDLSAMDGYALRLRAGSAAGPFLLGRRVFPGRPSDRPALRVGEAVYIATGAPLPPGSDAVVRVELTREEGGLVHLRHTARAGGDILRSGESVRRGDVILEPGQPIRPVDIGVLMALRVLTVPVYDLRASIFPIGDELTRPSSRATTKTPEYLGTIVAGLLGFCRVELSPPLPDDRDEVARALRRSARHCDLVITIGGSSVGAKDVTKRALNHAEGRWLFEGVTTNVLKRGAVGLIEGTPIVVLPGQIVSAVSVFHEHVLHVLSRMVGRELRVFEEVELDRAVLVPHRMDTMYLFRLSKGTAVPLAWGVARMTALLRAQAFGTLPRGRDHPPGERVRVQRLWSLNQGARFSGGPLPHRRDRSGRVRNDGLREPVDPPPTRPRREHFPRGEASSAPEVLP